MGIYIYVCHSSAHAQDNNNNYYLYVQWVAMVFLVYFPRRFGMQLPLVAMVLCEASPLMRISSNYYTHLIIVINTLLHLWYCYYKIWTVYIKIV